MNILNNPTRTHIVKNFPIRTDISWTNINQLDGNDSLSSFSESCSNEDLDVTDSSVSVCTSQSSYNSNQSEFYFPAWYDETTNDRSRLPPVRIHLKSNGRTTIGGNLPTFSVCNMRSLMPKIDNFANDVIERDIDLSFLGEVWEKVDDKSHLNKIEKLLEIKGIKYISTPRRTLKRCGGAALAVNLEKFNLEKIDITVPRKLEVCWGLLRPKESKSHIKRHQFQQQRSQQFQKQKLPQFQQQCSKAAAGGSSQSLPLLLTRLG